MTLNSEHLSTIGSRPISTVEDFNNLKVIRARHTSQNVSALLATAVIVGILHSVFTNPKWGWHVFAEWFFAEPVLVGLGRTLLLTVIATLAGSILGSILALARVSQSSLMQALSWSYIWLLRSIPLIVLLLILNNLGYLYETVSLSIPFTSYKLLDIPTSQLLTPFAAAILGLTLHQSAFFAEIVRGGILSVDAGQHEAAAALGLPRRIQATRIILPQAMRSILPTAFNEIIGLAKGTSVVYVLALPELFYTVQVIYRRNLEVIPLLMVATVWYLVIMVVLSLAQRYIEAYFAKGALRNPSRVQQRISRLFGSGNKDLAVIPTSNDVGGFGDAFTGGASIKVQNVSKSYGANLVLDDVSLSLSAGSVTAIIGPSGSGKSTLLRTINHLEAVDAGFIVVDGNFVGYQLKDRILHELKEKDVLKTRADIGMVFQGFNLFPHFTVLENLIEAPMRVRGIARKEAVQTAVDLLERVGLRDKANYFPRQLSGGQQQRVAIARALALKPKVLLFDEPTSALDPELVAEVLEVIKTLAKGGATLLVVTHELEFAREISDTVVFMDKGKIIETGRSKDVFGAPKSTRTAEFLNSCLKSTPPTCQESKNL